MRSETLRRRHHRLGSRPPGTLTPMSPPAARPSRSGEAATREIIRAAGLRATPQRIAVLAVAARAGGAHLSAEDVWQRLQRNEEMDRSTVYRVLADLTDAGLLEQVRLGDGVARFEIQEIAHHHAVCTRCGATEDVSVEAVHALASRLRRDTGFSLAHHPLLLPGICAACGSPGD